MPTYNLLQDSVDPIDVKNYKWGQRMFQPNPPKIQNADGSVSTHRMAADIDKQGNWWAYPTIVQKENGMLHQFENPSDAFKWNKQKGEAVFFGKDKNRALSFASGGYKQGTPINEPRSYVPKLF